MSVRARLVGCLVALLAISACGGDSAAVRSPSASPSPSSSASPSSSPSPAARPVVAGAPAWVTVSVASGWRSPGSVRTVDAPALENPVRIRDWIAAMREADKVGLIDRLDTQALLGDEVEVVELKSGWARVLIPDQATPLNPGGYPAWIPVAQLSATPPPDATEAVTITAPTARLLSPTGSLEVSYGTTLPLLGREGGTYTVGLPGGRVMSVETKAASPAVQAPSTSGILAAARGFLTLPYLWGGTSGFGFDCSGLVHLVYKANGVLVPRDSDPQSKFGAAVTRSQLQAGDLVFFSSGGVAYHVAIYAGAGMVIQSPSPGHSIEIVALDGLSFIADYSGARRVIGSVVPSPVTPTPSRLPASLAGAEWTALPTSDKVVALTFDAGGNNAGVGPILKALADAGVPATFFLTGRWTEIYPADARRIAAAYAVGNHTYSHPYLTQLVDARVKDEISHAETVIKTVTGREPRPLFRFPYGNVDSRVLGDAHALGYGGIRWTVDTLGWKGGGGGQSEATVLSRVVASLRPGEIVLMHVGAATDGSTLDASALPAIISAVQARGYHFVLISVYAR
jgi:gamma-D-glutamyl-L-lysine dipeptidyl-peptidase